MESMRRQFPYDLKVKQASALRKNMHHRSHSFKHLSSKVYHLAINIATQNNNSFYSQPSWGKLQLKIQNSEIHNVSTGMY